MFLTPTLALLLLPAYRPLLLLRLYKISAVTSSGGDRHGGMFGTGAFMYRTGMVENIIGSTVIRADEFAVEFQRDASKAITEVVGHAYVGVALVEDSRAVGIVTDA